MGASKTSISISEPLASFVESYRKKRGLKRSQVFEEAIKLLRSRELERAYRDADKERDETWEVTVSDGLEDETW